MNLNVVSLGRATRRSRNWTSQELGEFYRVEASLNRAGIPIETDRGLSDDGDPWFVFCHAHTGDVVIHFARFDGVYIVASPALNGCVRGHDFRALIEAQIDSHPLVVAKPNNSTAKLFIHPAALLVVLVTTCFLKLSQSSAAAAELNEASHTPSAGLAGHSGSGERAAQGLELDKRTTAVVLAAIAAGISWAQSYHDSDMWLASPISSWPDATGPDASLPASTALAAPLDSDGGALFHTHAQDGAPAVSDPTLQDALSHVASAPHPAGADDHLTTKGVDTSALFAPAPTRSLNSSLLTSAVVSSPTQHDPYGSVGILSHVIMTAVLPENNDAGRELTLLLGPSLRSHLVTTLTAPQQDIVNHVTATASANPDSAVASVNPDSAVTSAKPDSTVASPTVTASHAPPMISSAPAAPPPPANIPATNPTVAAETAIDSFTAQHPNFQLITEPREIIMYDPGLTPANLPTATEQTFSFSDGSSVVLIGLPPSHHHVTA